MKKVKVTIRGIAGFEKILGSKEIVWETNEGTKVADLLEELNIRYNNRLRKLLYLEDGRLNDWSRVLKNGKDIRFLEDNQLLLSNDDIILLMQPLAGG